MRASSLQTLDAHEDLVERLPLEIRNLGVGGRVADRDQDEGTLVLGPVEDLAEEPHRAGSVGERAEAGSLESGEQEADRDPDRLAHVVVLDLRSVRAGLPRLLEDDDHVGRVGDVRLDPVGADRADSLFPFVRRAAVVEVALLGLGTISQPALGLRIGDDDERPRLLVGARGRRARDANGVLDELPRDRLRREAAYRAARLHELAEPGGALERHGHRRAFVDERYRTVLGHSRTLFGELWALG